MQEEAKKFQNLNNVIGENFLNIFRQNCRQVYSKYLKDQLSPYQSLAKHSSTLLILQDLEDPSASQLLITQTLATLTSLHSIFQVSQSITSVLESTLNIKLQR